MALGVRHAGCSLDAGRWMWRRSLCGILQQSRLPGARTRWQHPGQTRQCHRRQSWSFTTSLKGLIRPSRSSISYGVANSRSTWRNNTAQTFWKRFRASRRYLMLTYASPGQWGWHHVNCQVADYWIEKLRKIDLLFDRDLTDASRQVAEPGHYRSKGLFFIRGAAHGARDDALRGTT